MQNKKYPDGYFCFGGLEGDRTLDLCVANAALSQLSYIPKFAAARLLYSDSRELSSIYLLHQIIFWAV